MINQSQNFWNFSVDLYSQERVADACLDLQNSYGIDVNMLLFCYWHGLNLGAFPEATLAQTLALSQTWKREVVQPLRNVRQWMKLQKSEFSNMNHAQFETLRSRIKFDELAAEKYQQELLEQIALAHTEHPGTESGAEISHKNVEKLFAAIGLEQNDLIAIKLRTIGKALQNSS